ncbi:receptor-like protein kinase haiku2 [Phtheirospermum japonicum]|uniref:non-specific serine/threonine protein kinase n=1 Tax=Phtheirospermum japonicum TaxID=374723 RepID=A0A830C5V7_9LAMI|nr:receptor-like protein kinase haiku2 [Phtheirospermum japonicum]
MAAAIVFHFLCLLSVAASDDLQTLLQIKASFRDSNTNSLFDSWESNTTACEFPGITCDSKGFVKEMELSNQNLLGSLPINPICQLKSLEKLSLGFNKLHGRVGDDLNNCSSLKYLDLGNNFFSGLFPDISSMNELVYLYANRSGFSGTFPWSSLGNMKNLQVLSLGDNSFDRSPFPREIVNLTNLNWLYLSNCSIDGEIPEEIGNLAELINLELSMNYISGAIPKGITKLNKLWQLELYSNLLTGELPLGMQNLTNLEFFDASTNSLSGNLSEIRFLNKLKSLQLFENQFSGEVPAELGDFKSLVNLSLYMNKLTGPLPQKLGSWAEFYYIDVSENLLSGPIPPDMCKKGTMTKLLMLENNFTGEIPGSYANCTKLIRFRVNKNGLSGQVPSGIWGLPNAQIIDVGNNDFEGPVTSDIKNAKSLGQLFLANNRLSGELPPEISKASSLVSIDLSNNRFSGEIPYTIGELNQLTSLYLQGNNFSGSIPDSLGSCYSINDINIAQNNLSGLIPASLGSLPTLNFLNLSRNQLSGPIPGSLAVLRLNLLDLSQNRLSGPIPVSLLTAANNGSFSGNNGLCSENVRSFRPCSRKSTTPHIRIVLFSLILVCVALIASLAGFCYIRRKGERHVGERSLKDDSWFLKSFHVLTFTEDEILDSIKQENLVGKGGSGNVYRVVVGNGKELAVKHIWHSDEYSGSRKIGSSTPILARRESNNHKAREFEAEAQTLSSIRHINVVKLYCSISSEDSSLLVYEYMPNGSLWDRLHNCKKLELDWEQRYDIALGAAKGLEYLHHGCDRPVIHRDVKSSNILLDEHLKPRIADFGLAKIVQAHSTKESTQIIAGTHGYIAPEYGYTNKVNEKSDLYSFGVVLMELVTGKRPIEPEFGENKDIVDWVLGNLKTKESVVSMVDSAIDEIYRESAIKVLKVAILCTARLPNLRPTMRTVVHMLEEAQPSQFVSIIVTKDGEVKKDELMESEKLRFEPRK